MRRLRLDVPAGRGAAIVGIAEANGALTTSLSSDRDRDVLVVHLENDRVGPVLAAVAEVTEVEASWHPSGVLTLVPPAEETPERLLDPTQRSPIEVILAGRMSAGSWTSLLTFAAVAGAVAWVGLLGGTWYLLTAAMLIAPYAGPAMNGAIATAHGDARLLGHALARYAVGILATAVSAGLLHALLGPARPTPFMVTVVSQSSVAVVLPLAAGIVGAMFLIQSENSSLVSGAAVGILVAASLAPPAALLGMLLVTGDLALAGRALFVLVLQLTGIHVTATLVFRMAGVSPQVPRLPAPHPWLLPVATTVAGVATVALVVFQLSATPSLRRGTLEAQATAAIEQRLSGEGLGELLDASVRYAPLSGEPRLLASVQVRVPAGAPDDIDERLRTAILERLDDPLFGAEPLVDVTVFRPQ